MVKIMPLEVNESPERPKVPPYVGQLPDMTVSAPSEQGDQVAEPAVATEVVTEMAQATGAGHIALEKTTYLDAPFRDIHVRGRVDALEDSPEQIADEVRSRWQQARNEILKLPSHEYGLNMDRVNAYCQQAGIPNTPVRLLEPTDYQAVLGKHGRADLPNGRYLNDTDVVVMERDLSPGSLESLNGPELIESLTVHEKAHASNEHHPVEVDVTVEKRMFRRDQVNLDPKQLRMGSIVTNHSTGEQEGFSLDEAYGEYERGQYVVNELGKPRGFTGGINPDGEPNILDKYTYFKTNKDGKVGLMIPEGAVPAATLELMIEHDPKLLDGQRESRRSVDGLRELARRIEAVSPGLYTKLRKLDIKSEDGAMKAVKLLHQVEDALAEKAKPI